MIPTLEEVEVDLPGVRSATAIGQPAQPAPGAPGAPRGPWRPAAGDRASPASPPRSGLVVRAGADARPWHAACVPGEPQGPATREGRPCPPPFSSPTTTP